MWRKYFLMHRQLFAVLVGGVVRGGGGKHCFSRQWGRLWSGHLCLFAAGLEGWASGGRVWRVWKPPWVCRRPSVRSIFLSTMSSFHSQSTAYTHIHKQARTQTQSTTVNMIFFCTNTWQERSVGCRRPPWSPLSFYEVFCQHFLLYNFILLAKQLCGTSCLCFLCGFVCVHFALTRTVNQHYKQVIHITVCCVFNGDCGDCSSLLASSSFSVNLIALSSCLHSVKFLAFHLLPYEESVSGRHNFLGGRSHIEPRGAARMEVVFFFFFSGESFWGDSRETRG